MEKISISAEKSQRQQESHNQLADPKSLEYRAKTSMLREKNDKSLP